MSRLSTLAASLCLFSTPLSASALGHSGPMAHAPIGVMADHCHNEGEFMASYRYSYMSMDGNRDGTHHVSTSSVHDKFMVAPLSMSMQMHMFGAMYGICDNLTAMAMLPYTSLSMKHITKMGARFETKSSGVGDLRLSLLYRIFKTEQHHLHLIGGLSCPTGGIDHKDQTPMGYVRLPYPMQIGSGTWDLLEGITYTRNSSSWTWGAQASGVLRLGDNDHHYRLGHQVNSTAWVAKAFFDWLSASLRVEGRYWGDIAGADKAQNPMMAPTARTDLRGGTRVELLAGLNTLMDHLKGHRIALEIGLPVYQNLHGPQLETDWRVMGGWQLAF